MLLYLFVLVVATAFFFFFLVLLSLSSLGGMSPGRASVAFALVLVAFLVAAWGGRRVARGCPSVPWGRCLFSLLSWFSSRFCGSSDGLCSSSSWWVSPLSPFFGPFCGFSELRGARQVERLAACSLRHLPQVVFHPDG